MSIAGWVFMLTSITVVSLFTFFCVFRVLTASTNDEGQR